MKQRETLIRKIIPVELFDMAGLEHWLSDMAAQGLHLVKLNHDTARFRRGEPVPGVRFRPSTSVSWIRPSSWNLPSRVYSVPGPSRTRSRVLRATNSVISVPHISRFKKDMRT